MIKNFVQLFDIKSFERMHLSKDVGMIPSLLHSKYKFNSTIVYYGSEKNHDITSIEDGIYLERINTNFINRIKALELVFSPMIFYLIKNARKIDYLMLFHLKKQNYFYRFIYKLLNPNGKIYIKLDINAIGIRGFKKYLEFELLSFNLLKISNLKQLILIMKKKIGFKYLKNQLLKFDLISVETREAFDEINKATQNILYDKMLLLPNGISGQNLMLSKRKEFYNKENIIITVGRIGTEVKNNEMLLNAIKLIDLKNWKVYFIGPIEPSFIEIIDEFYHSNPNLTDKVFFIGNISDKTSLYDWYARSKVFCLTSYSEGFPLVFPEALYYGNYIVSTKVGADVDITNQGQLGHSVDINDYKGLANILEDIINGKNKIEDKYYKIIKFCDDIFLWEKIIDELYIRLMKLDNAIINRGEFKQ